MKIDYKKMVGQNFGRITVVSVDKEKKGKLVCRCVCGKVTKVFRYSLINGDTQSCGCLRYEKLRKSITSHGMCGTPTYKSWTLMKSRCFNPKSTQYKWYGARGVIVCDRWKKCFKNFYEDMGDRPEGHTLDRINVEKGYCKKNCKWSTQKEQTRNTRRNVVVEVEGVKMNLAEVAEKYGLKYKYFHSQYLKNNRDVELTLNLLIPSPHQGQH